MTKKTYLDSVTINAVLEALNQPVSNATEACAIVRALALKNHMKLSDDPELSKGDFWPENDRGSHAGRALQALSSLEDWCHFNEAEFTGWGDGEVPEGAMRWTAQAKMAQELVKDMLDPKTLIKRPTFEIEALERVVMEVERTEETHTRNAGTDYRCRVFISENGQAILDLFKDRGLPLPQIQIVKYVCYTDSGQLYHQYDTIVNGNVDTGWCDNLSEALEQAAKIPGAAEITIKLGGDLPQERR